MWIFPISGKLECHKLRVRMLCEKWQNQNCCAIHVYIIPYFLTKDAYCHTINIFSSISTKEVQEKFKESAKGLIVANGKINFLEPENVLLI
jgi:hypothetical protein